jgi:hypothetical protein
MQTKALWTSLLAAAVTFSGVAPAPADLIFTAANNAVGVYFKGQVYCFWPKNDLSIHNEIYLNGSLYSGLPSPGGSSHAQIAPLVIENVLWVFHTGEDCNIYFKRYNESSKTWDSSWHQIPNVSTRNDYEIAPVYNPLTHRLVVYYFYSNYLYWVFSDNYGAAWSAGRRVGNLQFVSSAPSAVFCPGPHSDTLLALVGPNNLIPPDPIPVCVKLLTIENGAVTSDIGTSWRAAGRPFAVDVNTDSYAVLWRSQDTGSTWICKMDKATGVWQEPSVAISDSSTYSPTGVVKDVLKKANGPWYGEFYLMWGDGAITRPVVGSWAVDLYDSWPLAVP